MTLTEARRIGYLFEESNGVLTEGILDKIKDSIKKKFSKEETEDIKQNLSDNLGIDENSSVEEIEEKLREETGGKDNFGLLKKVLKEIAGFGAMSLAFEIQAMIGAGIIKFFDYSPIAIAAVVIYTLYSVSENWEKIRRKGLGKKVDQFIFGKRGHLGDFDDKKNKDENDKEMNENRKVIRLTELDLTRIVKRVIQENKKQNLNEGLGTGLLVLTGVGALYLVRKLKKFVDRYGKYVPMARITPFLAKAKKIIDGDDEEGEIVVTENKNMTVVAIKKDGKIFDAFTLDMKHDMVYDGTKAFFGTLRKSDLIVPMTLPKDADTEHLDEIKEAEEELVNGLLEIIAKYGKKKDEE